MSPADIVTAAVVAVVGTGAVWLVRRIVRGLRALAENMMTELREIARIPDEVSALVGAVAALVSELQALKRRIDHLETAFAMLDLTPDHVTMSLLATNPHEHDKDNDDREGARS